MRDRSRPALRLTLAALALGTTGACRHQPALESQPITVYDAEARAAPLAEASIVQVTARQIARRGAIDVGVKDLAPARDRLERAVGMLGGQVGRSTIGDKHAFYVLHVPSAQLGAMMDSAAALGDVESRTVTATDVTDQVIDTEARLNALRASRDRLRQLFERASTVQDVVAVERELARVQGELESLEARLAVLKNEVARSELFVRLDQKTVPGPLGAVLMGLGAVIGKLFVWR